MTEIAIIERLLSGNPAVAAAEVAAITSVSVTVLTLLATVLNTPFKYWFDNMALNAKLKIEYRSKNLENLNDLTGRYKGLLLAGAESLNTRFWNLYKNESELWMHVNGDYPGPRYYFRSWIRRLVRVVATATAFENEALYIDQTIGTDTDFQFIYMVKSWTYVLSNVNVFDNIDYDKNRQYDHLYQDTVRAIGEATWLDGRFVTDDKFDALIASNQDLRSLCTLLDGISSTEERLRWDRLVCFHILLLIFLNTFGYPIHHTPQEKIAAVINKIKHRQIKYNLMDVLTRWHLRKSKAGKLVYRLLEQELWCVPSPQIKMPHS